MTPLSDRPRYAPRAPVDWRLLPALVAVPAVAALALGWVLKTLFVHGWYLIILAPMVAAVMLAGVVAFSVGFTKCRSRLLAGGVGIVSALLLYFGYYHFCLIDFLPPGLEYRVDLLPEYVWARLQTDVAVDVGAPKPGVRAGDKPIPRQEKPALGMNLFQFGFELLACLGIVTAAAWKRSGRAFCEELGQWMKREQALLPPEFTPDFVNALEAGRLAEFVAAAPRGSDPASGGLLVLEYVGHASGPALDYPVYASAEDFDLSRWFPPLRRTRRTTLRQVELEPSEVLELRPRFPELARILEVQHPRLREEPVAVVTPIDLEVPAEEVAQITPVPEPYRQRVRGPGYALAVNLRGAIPLAFLLPGAGLVAAGIWRMTEGDILLGCLLAAVGAPGVAWGIYTATLCMGVYENRWIRRRLCQEIAQRPDVLVHPDDPDARYVSIIPRESFVTVKLTMSSDLLLLKIDRQRRQILLEGDADRYRIPAGAITACEPQMFFHPMDAQHHNEFWLVRLMVRVPQGSQELLISAGTNRFTPTTNDVRRQRAGELCRQIRELTGGTAEPGADGHFFSKPKRRPGETPPAADGRFFSEPNRRPGETP
jgi:hypothetical protein